LRGKPGQVSVHDTIDNGCGMRKYGPPPNAGAGETTVVINAPERCACLAVTAAVSSSRLGRRQLQLLCAEAGVRSEQHLAAIGVLLSVRPQPRCAEPGVIRRGVMVHLLHGLGLRHGRAGDGADVLRGDRGGRAVDEVPGNLPPAATQSAYLSTVPS